MAKVINFYGVRYALIQASSQKDGPERLVIAYQDENCLRDLIAASSIVGLGFASRDEAVANLEGHMSDAAPSKQRPRTTAMFHVSMRKVSYQATRALRRRRRKFQGILHSALSTLTALFHS